MSVAITTLQSDADTARLCVMCDCPCLIDPLTVHLDAVKAWVYARHNRRVCAVVRVCLALHRQTDKHAVCPCLDNREEERVMACNDRLDGYRANAPYGVRNGVPYDDNTH